MLGRLLGVLLGLSLGLAAPAWAAMEIATGSLALSTGAIGTTFTISGLSFQPNAVILMWTGRTATGTAEADERVGVGFFTSTTSRRCYTGVSDHANANSVVDQMWRDDAAVCLLAVGGAVDGLADVDAITSDGFRLIVDDVFLAAYLLEWTAIGGSDVTDATIVDWTNPGVTGDQDITSVGFGLDTGIDDKLVVIVGGPESAVNTAGVHHWLSLGAAAGETPAQATTYYVSVDAQGNGTTFGYSKSGEVLAGWGGFDSIGNRASLTAWLSNGFRLDWAEDTQAAGQIRYSALVLKGGRYEVGTLTTSTGTTNQTEATAYEPRGLLLVSHAKAESTIDTTQTPGELSIGMVASASSRRAIAVLEKDNVTTTDMATSTLETAMYINLSTATTIVVEGLMDLVSFDATPGFTWVMDDADPAASFVWYVNFASAPAAATCPRTLALLGVGC